MKRLPPGLMLAGLGMSIAVSLLCLFAAGVTDLLPVSAVCLFVASLMIWVPIREEHGLLFAVIEFVIVGGLALLISRRSVYTYLYLLIFGCYGIIRYLLRTRIRDRFMTVLLRLLYLNLMSAAAIALLRYVLKVDAMSFIPGVPVWLVIAIMEAVFVVYIILYRFFTYLFDSAVRNKLLPRR